MKWSIKAQYQNDFTKDDLQGKAELDKIDGILQDLDIKGSNQNTIESHNLYKLDLEKGYKQFQLEATYNNGKEIEFEM